MFDKSFSVRLIAPLPTYLKPFKNHLVRVEVQWPNCPKLCKFKYVLQSQLPLPGFGTSGTVQDKFTKGFISYIFGIDLIGLE